MPGFELIGKEEQAEVNDVFKSGGVLFRHGFEDKRNNCFKVNKFEEMFKKKIGSKYALAVTSGTAALRVALATLNLKPNDEVITQAFTFVATVEAIIESKAKPIISEIDETLNMDPEDLEKKINKNTKAVIVVHMLGTPCNIFKIKQICRKYNLILIEDTAWGIGATIKNKKLGTIGDIGTYSFDFAKTITTGEGGMIVFKDKKKFRFASVWHDHGHENNPKVPRWEDTRSSSGFNYRMTELQAAVGIAQLKKLGFILKSHRKNKKKIMNKIKKFENITLRKCPSGSNDSAEALIFLTTDNKTALKVRNALLNEGLSTKILPEATTWHFAKKWLHMKELRLTQKRKSYLKKSENLLGRCVSIPINVKMNEKVPNKIRIALEKSLY